MTERETGGPAFPTDTEQQIGSGTWHFEGMTLRDYFAGKAMAGAWNAINDEDVLAEVAAHCYRMADAMIAERAK